MAAQLLRIQAGPGTIGRRNDVRDQVLDAGPVFAHHHHGLGDRRMRAKHRRHLAWLNPEPAQLDLVVGAAGEHDVAVIGPAHQVTGPVHPRPWRTERVRDEPLRR